LLRGLRPRTPDRTPESSRAATLPTLTWQVTVAALKDSSMHLGLCRQSPKAKWRERIGVEPT